MIPRGASAVMASRVEPPDSLELFCTPPFATRALFERVLPAFQIPIPHDVWEPAAGKGHIAEVMKEYAINVVASDIANYGMGYEEADFLDPNTHTHPVEWIITNPPFSTAMEFTLRALAIAQKGVAMLVRLQWIEGIERYECLFRDNRPTIFAPFVERVPMVKGCWDPKASTATAYAWWVWEKSIGGGFECFQIPPCRPELTKPNDARRFGSESSGALL